MKRTTVMLSDEAAGRLTREARRRGVSVATIVREAVERHVPAEKPGALSFFALGEGRSPDDSEHVDEIVLAALRNRRADG